MSTPFSKIKSMRLALFKRLMIILTVGGIAAYGLGMLMAKRLVTPLDKLSKKARDSWEPPVFGGAPDPHGRRDRGGGSRRLRDGHLKCHKKI